MTDEQKQLSPGQYDRFRPEEPTEGLPAEVETAGIGALQTNKRLYLLRTKVDEPEAEWILLRVPTRAEYTRFMEAIDSTIKDQRTVSHRNLAVQTTIYPARGELTALLDEWPGLAFTIANTVIKISGFGDATAAKK